MAKRRVKCPACGMPKLKAGEEWRPGLCICVQEDLPKWEPVQDPTPRDHELESLVPKGWNPLSIEFKLLCRVSVFCERELADHLMISRVRLNLYPLELDVEFGCGMVAFRPVMSTGHGAHQCIRALLLGFGPRVTVAQMSAAVNVHGLFDHRHWDWRVHYGEW